MLGNDYLSPKGKCGQCTTLPTTPVKYVLRFEQNEVHHFFLYWGRGWRAYDIRTVEEHNTLLHPNNLLSNAVVLHRVNFAVMSRHSVISGDIFGCHNCGEGGVLLALVCTG